MLEIRRDQFWAQPYSWFLLMIFPMMFYQEYGYMHMPALSIAVMVSLFFERVESAGELELDLRSIVEWGDRWLVQCH